MKIKTKCFFLSLIACLVLAPSAFADYPTGCSALQDCVDTGAPTLLSTCQSSNPTCDLTQFNGNQTLERFAATSGEIADRALELKNCASKTTKGACNACYQSAKAPLRNRFFGKIFHGLLANAIQLIEEQRKAVCLALPKNSKK